MKYLSNSEAACWKRCRRKWWLTWYRNLHPAHQPMNDARAKGTRIHEALAEWYVPDGVTRTHPAVALERIIARDAPDVSQDMPELASARLAGWTKETDLERAMMEGYVDWTETTGVDADLEILAPERSLRAQLTDDVVVIGRLDVDARLRSTPDERLQMDHKSTGNFTELSSRLNQDEQLLTYLTLQLAHVETEERCTGALYNMLRKVKRTAAAKPPFYERVVIKFNDHQVRTFATRLRRTADDIVSMTSRLDQAGSLRAQAQIAYPSPTKNCSWDCDHRHVCPMFDDGSRAEDMVQALYVESPLSIRYPELKEASNGS